MSSVSVAPLTLVDLGSFVGTGWPKVLLTSQAFWCQPFGLARVHGNDSPAEAHSSRLVDRAQAVGRRPNADRRRNSQAEQGAKPSLS